jgi:excisionase family DNA binding protein
MDRNEWMTVEEVAAYFRVSVETVRRWIRRNELPVLTLGGPRAGYRIRRTDVAAFAEARYGTLETERGHGRIDAGDKA